MATADQQRAHDLELLRQNTHDSETFRAAWERLRANAYAGNLEPVLDVCPICRSDEAPRVMSDAFSRFVRCDGNRDGCGTTGPYKRTESDAIAAWNTRPESEVEEAARALVRPNSPTWDGAVFYTSPRRNVNVSAERFNALCRALGEPTTDEWGGEG